MTKKQIEGISLSHSIAILNEFGVKINFDTKDKDIRAAARKIVRNQKKKQWKESQKQS